MNNYTVHIYKLVHTHTIRTVYCCFHWSQSEPPARLYQSKQPHKLSCQTKSGTSCREWVMTSYDDLCLIRGSPDKATVVSSPGKNGHDRSCRVGSRRVTTRPVMTGYPKSWPDTLGHDRSLCHDHVELASNITRIQLFSQRTTHYFSLEKKILSRFMLQCEGMLTRHTYYDSPERYREESNGR